MWSTWLEAEESRQTVKFASVLREEKSREVPAKLSIYQKDKVFIKFFTHTINTFIIHEL